MSVRAQLPEPAAADALYVVDLSGYVFRAYHAIQPLSSSKGEPTHAVLGTTTMLQKVVAARKPARFAVAMDSKKRSLRKERDARYKANRPPPPPDLSSQMHRCEQIVRAYRIPVFQAEGFEADDLIAAVTARALADGLRVVVVSADKDLMQLVRDDDARVVLWDSMREKVYGPDEVREKFGVAPSALGDLLALTGDTSDNVPGVPGVGPKTAADLLAQHGSLEGIYRALAQGDEAVKRPKLRESLRAHEDDARLSRELVTLREDAPLVWEPDALGWGGGDVDELRRLFRELEFQRLLEQLEGAQPAGPGPGLGAGASKGADRSGAPSGGAGASARAPAPPAGPRSEPVTIVDRAALDALLARAKTAGALGLGTLATERDPMRAALVGLSLGVAGEAAYVPVGHRVLLGGATLGADEVLGALRPVLADPAVRKVGHDLKTTEVLLARLGAPLDGPTGDAALVAYLLDPEAPVGLDALTDRELGVALVKPAPAPPAGAKAPKRKTATPVDQIDPEEGRALAGEVGRAALDVEARLAPRARAEGLGGLYEDLELPLARVLARMETRGVLVDVAALGAASKRAEQEISRLEAEAHALAGRPFAVRSRDQLEAVLFDELGLRVVKKTPKGGRSTDAEVLEELSDAHGLPKVVLEYRELDKLKGTYLDALPRAVNPATGRIHSRFEQTVAATGRLSSADPNLQNIPIRTELGRSIRRAFVAPEGYRIVSADYSQIELRVLAHLSQDPALVDAFTRGGDVHAHTASLVFDVPLADVTPTQRRQAKTINFGVIYGMGESALAKQLGIPRDEAARFIAAYFTRYAGVRALLDGTVEKARSGEAVRTVLGRRRFLPNLHAANRGLRMEAERVAKNTPIQGTAADILKLAMVELGRAPVVPGAHMVLTVHDELVFEVPSGDVERAKATVREAMASAMKLSVPLEVDARDGANWGEAH